MERKRRNSDKNAAATLVEAVKTSVGPSIASSHVVAVVGKMSAGCEAGGFAYDLIAFDDELSAVGVLDHPFAAEKSDGPVRIVADREVINKRVRPVGRQLLAAVPIDKFVDFNAQAGQFE